MDEKYPDVIDNMSNPNYLLGRIRRLEDLIGLALASFGKEQPVQEFAQSMRNETYEQNPNPETNPINREALEDVRRGWSDCGRSVADTIEHRLK